MLMNKLTKDLTKQKTKQKSCVRYGKNLNLFRSRQDVPFVVLGHILSTPEGYKITYLLNN